MLVFSASWASAQLLPLLNPNFGPQQSGGIQITIQPPDGFLVEGPLAGDQENEDVYVIVPDPEHNFGTEGNVPPNPIEVNVVFVALGGRTLIQPAPTGANKQTRVTVELQRFGEHTIEWKISPDANDPEDKPNGHLTLVYATGRIMPAKGQRGKTGDLVDSIRGETGERHYVSPRKPPSLPAGYEEHINTDEHVVLELKGVSRKDFDEYLEWELLDGLTEVPDSDPPRLLVSREDPNHFRVRARLKETGTPVDLLNTWIVWATVTRIPDPNLAPHQIRTDTIPAGSMVKTSQVFKGEIIPLNLFDIESDIPELRGPPATASPEEGLTHAADPQWQLDRPLHKWHIAQRIRLRADAQMIDGANSGYPQGAIVYNGFPTSGFDLLPTLDPAETAAANGYPENPLLGNDTATRHLGPPNPYNPANVLGEIQTSDDPLMAVGSGVGVANDFCIFHADFETYARVEIGGTYYLVSEYFHWQFRARFDHDGTKWVPAEPPHENPSFVSDGNLEMDFDDD